MNKTTINPIFRAVLSVGCALALLAIFVTWNHFHSERVLKENRAQGKFHEREIMRDTAGYSHVRLAFHDFETGNASDTASHLVSTGHQSRQSLQLSSRVPFSPGLWIRFRDLKPPGSAWIKVTGYVWFSCRPEEAKCHLVVTCNHRGVNFKYMFIACEEENLKPNQWNRVSLGYRIPPAPDAEDVLQAYFWYCGNGSVLVDDIEVEMFSEQ